MPRYRVVAEKPNERAVHHRLFVYVAPDGQDTYALAGVLAFRRDEVDGFVQVLTSGGQDVFELERLTVPSGTTVVTDPTLPPGQVEVVGEHAARRLHTVREETGRGIPQD